MQHSDEVENRDVKQALSETPKPLEYSAQGRQQLVNKLKRTRREYLAIFDSVPAMIWYRDRDGRILKANRCAADSVGMSVRDLVGKNYYTLFPDGAERALRQDLEVIETGRSLLGQLRPFTGLNGLQRWALVDRIPLRDENSRITGVMVFAIDITKQKRAEDDLLKSQQQLEQTIQRLKATAEEARLLAEKATRANQAKGQLLASSSHDLRSPMNSILGFAEILMGTPLDDEQKEYVKTIHNAGKGLLSLIDDILNYSRIEAGRLNVEIIPCPLAESVQQVFKMMEMQVREKGLDFIVEIDKTLPPTFFTDPMRLRQCLVNLIGNAVKFTDRGHIAVFVRPTRSAGQQCIRFEVVDTGIGIPEDKQELIFNPYAQADSLTADQYGGTGLGLAITRRLAGLLGGDVSLTSELGKGSTFSLTLPLLEPSCDQDRTAALGRRPEQRAEDDGANRGRILLAEKAFPSQLTLALMCRRFGLDVQLAGSVDQARRCLEENDFDLVFLDAEMGFEPVIELAQSSRAKMPDAGVVLLADDDSGREQQWRQAGFAECLFRPLTREQLYAVIERHLPEKTIDSDDSSWAQQSQDSIAPAESLLERLRELAQGIREVLMQSDLELVTRFAELFAEIGRTAGQDPLVENASHILDRICQKNVSVQDLTGSVDRLCRVCEQIHQTQAKRRDEKANA